MILETKLNYLKRSLHNNHNMDSSYSTLYLPLICECRLLLPLFILPIFFFVTG